MHASASELRIYNYLYYRNINNYHAELASKEVPISTQNLYNICCVIKYLFVIQEVHGALSCVSEF